MSASRVLVVDDTPANIDLLEALLAPAGYTVMSATCGADALAMVATGTPDLILTDVVMPDMGGLELAGQLGARWPDLTLIYMSGYAEGDKLDPRFEGVDGSFLQKPFSAEELVQKVREVLDARPRRIA